MWWKYYVLIDENGNMRPVQTIPGLGNGGKRRIMEGVNSAMIYCKNFCKCHSAPSVQQE
jgi:hypothetical protein